MFLLSRTSDTEQISCIPLRTIFHIEMNLKNRLGMTSARKIYFFVKQTPLYDNSPASFLYCDFQLLEHRLYSQATFVLNKPSGRRTCVKDYEFRRAGTTGVLCIRYVNRKSSTNFGWQYWISFKKETHFVASILYRHYSFDQ